MKQGPGHSGVALGLAVVVLLLQTAAGAAATSVFVAAGTPVGLTLGSTVDASVAENGNKVHFTVAADVIVDRHVVIRKGTTLTGTINQVKKPGGLDNTSSVNIAFLSVAAADKKPLVLKDVFLRPKPGLFGGNVKMSPGEVVSTVTKNDATVMAP